MYAAKARGRDGICIAVPTTPDTGSSDFPAR
jgi:hypothetical protein